jgi:hypothetical protein
MDVSVHLHAPTTLPQKRAPDTHWIGDWVGHKAGLDAVEWIKITCPAGNRTPAVQPADIQTELSRLLNISTRYKEVKKITNKDCYSDKC